MLATLQHFRNPHAPTSKLYCGFVQARLQKKQPFVFQPRATRKQHWERGAGGGLITVRHKMLDGCFFWRTRYFWPMGENTVELMLTVPLNVREKSGYQWFTVCLSFFLKGPSWFMPSLFPSKAPVFYFVPGLSEFLLEQRCSGKKDTGHGVERVEGWRLAFRPSSSSSSFIIIIIIIIIIILLLLLLLLLLIMCQAGRHVVAGFFIQTVLNQEQVTLLHRQLGKTTAFVPKTCHSGRNITDTKTYIIYYDITYIHNLNWTINIFFSMQYTVYY